MPVAREPEKQERENNPYATGVRPLKSDHGRIKGRGASVSQMLLLFVMVCCLIGGIVGGVMVWRNLGALSSRQKRLAKTLEKGQAVFQKDVEGLRLQMKEDHELLRQELAGVVDQVKTTGVSFEQFRKSSDEELRGLKAKLGQLREDFQHQKAGSEERVRELHRMVKALTLKHDEERSRKEEASKATEKDSAENPVFSRSSTSQAPAFRSEP